MAINSPFEADVCPETGFPRVRFNFANGWTASIALRTSRRGMHAQMASLACFPTGKHGTGLTELGESEASPDEAARFIDDVRCREVV